MKGLMPLMTTAAALGLALNPPVESDDEAIGEIEDTLEWLHMNDEDGDGARAKLQNLAILRAQVDRYAEFLIAKLSPAEINFCVMEATE
jgi:hypothetical protein